MINFSKVILLTTLIFTINAFCEEVTNYELYKPQTADYKVSPSQKDGGFAYNGRPSIAFFEGLFYAAWQANNENKADVAGRRIYISTSKNLINWSKPTDFLIRQSINPTVPSVISEEKQGYPVLYNYNDKELWCFWCVDGLPSEKTNAGLYKSVLEAGSKLWYSAKIFQVIEIGEAKFYMIPTQKPVELRSGKIVLPVRLCQGGITNGTEFSVPAFMFSSDEGQNWSLGGTVSLPENPMIQCDTAIHQQKNGKIRVFSLPDYRNNLPPMQRLLTTTGSGTELEDDMDFVTDLRAAGIETTSGNIASTQLASDKYAMVIGDIFAEVNGPNLCYNPAVFFSRTGENDFIGGYPFAIGEEISHAQIMEKENRLYIIYSKNIGTDQNSTIGLSWVEMPEKDKHYIFPRSKDILRSYDTSFVRTNEGGFLKRKKTFDHSLATTSKDGQKNALIFTGNSSAAIDIEPVKLKDDENLEISLSMKITELQDTGELTLFTVGSMYPAKLVMPSGRAGDIYISAPNVYKKISAKESGKWFTINISFNKDRLQFQIDDEEAVDINNELTTQVFYIGNNCIKETTAINNGSSFCIDIDSVKSKANRKEFFIEY